MFWEKPENKKLITEWNERLAKEGLGEIEKTNLIAPTYRVNSWTERDAKLEYYLTLAEYIQSKGPEFDCEIDFYIMHKFSIGASNAEVEKSLKALGTTLHRKTIMYIRRKYESRWGLRKWKPDQLKSQKKTGSK